MSDDLISRKALTEGRVENDPVRIAAMCAPTAFDKEKVIEKLKRLEANAFRYYNQYDDEEAFGESAAYRVAIEIVEKGWIE